MRTLLLFSTSAALLTIPCLASELWDGPAFAAAPAAVLEAASKIPVKEGTDAVVLLMDRSYQFDEQGRRTYKEHLVVRALTAAGVENWDAVDVRWEPWHEERPEIRARVITADGVVHELDPKTVAESSGDTGEGALYRDLRILRAPLPAIAPGAVVEWEKTLRETAPLFAAGRVDICHFGYYYPAQRSRMTVDAPASLPLHTLIRLLPSLETKRTERDGRVHLVFEQGPMEPVEEAEPNLPSDTPRWPFVGISTAKSWNEVARAYGRAVDEQIANAGLGSLMKGIETAGKSRQEIGAALLNRLHEHVRYTGVEFGEAALIPRTPAETLKRKYGDCKDQAALLVAMLREAGVEAHVALLLSGGGEDLERELPGIGVFDHVIVYAPGSPAVWVDPTHEYARFGEIPGGDQGRLALIAAEDTQELVRTPETESSENRTVETREFFLAETGKARVIETTQAWGEAERDYRSGYAVTEAKDIKERLESYAKDHYLSDDPPKFEYSNVKDLSAPFRLRIEVTDSGRGLTGAADAGVGIPVSDLMNQLPGLFSEDPDEKKKDSRRKNDLVLAGPFVKEWRYKITPPPGFRPVGLPESVKQQLGPATLERQYSASEDGVVTATLRFDTGKRRYTAEEVEALRKQRLEIRKAPMPLVRFEQIGEALLASGRIREALTEFRRLAELHPKEALHHNQVARAMLAAGAGETARKEAHRATELEPKSAAAFGTLGGILQHDLVGRRFGKGCDLAGAAAAYRKAAELDPSDAAYRANLAITLESTPDGERYASREHVEQAVAEYRQIEDKLKDVGIPDNLLIALLWARQFEELRKKTADNTTPAGHALWLAATAAIEGGPAAVSAAANRLGNDQGRRATALLTAGQTLMNLRLYAQAADLLEAGSSASQNPVAVRILVEALRKTVPFEERQYPASDPAGPLQKAIPAMFMPKGSGVSLPELFTANSPIVKPENEELLSRAIRPFRTQVSKGGMPLNVATDLASAMMRTFVDGDDAGGRRVRGELTGLGGVHKLTAYIVRENGGYRIRVMGDLPSLGTEALARLERGEVEHARRWLDWAREEQQPAGGDDPMAGPMFPLMWTKGAEADANAIRAAAAVLMAGGPDSAQAAPILEEMRAKASPADQSRFDTALYRGYFEMKRWEDALKAAQRVMAAYPDSETAFGATAEALDRMRGWDEAEKLIEERLRRKPEELTALRTAANIALSRGQTAQAIQYGQKLVALGKAAEVDLNNLAWAYLVAGNVTAEALDIGQRAAYANQQRSYSVLHTLASLYAEVGKPTEARQMILQGMEAGGVEEPDSSAWYVFGRIAEQFGIEEEALADYRRVEKPEEGERSDSTYELAQRRIRAITGKK